MSGSCVGGKIDRDGFHVCSAVVDGDDWSKRVGVVEAAQYAYLQLVLGGSLLEVEGELECVDIAVELGHGVDAALVEQECVVSAVCVRGVEVDHGFVLVGHGDILVSESPAGRLDASLGGCGGCICVEVVCVGEVCHSDAGTVVGTEFKGEVVDVVATEVTGLTRGENVAEGDVVAAAGIVGEVDGCLNNTSGAVVDSFDRSE